ncbi:MAG: spore coat protein GerQ [Clostridium sp.]|nr:MAG: spore coat protein GerQ [Clostridium sp.]
MNGSYYRTPVFINDIERDTNNPIIDNFNNSNEPIEQSYIENILRNNIGKKVRVHASFSDSVEWRDRVFVGLIEHAGRDNLIINDVENNKSYLILMIYVDFVEFDERITYAK